MSGKKQFAHFGYLSMGSVISRLTCWAYIPLFYNSLRMAPQCHIC